MNESQQAVNYIATEPGESPWGASGGRAPEMDGAPPDEKT